MCGIHLIWGKGANEENIQKLVGHSHHRGPDQQAVLSPWAGLWIGVNRLKILDLGTEANQPFWDSDGNYLLIWNGEIYNYSTLRSILEKMGVPLQSKSDTEVLLYYLKFFGTEALTKIQGMFSLIFIDLLQQSVLIARDPTGEKPLYFFQNPDSLIVSSETKGIANLLGLEVDAQQITSYFYFRFPLPGKSAFKGIREWKPGRYSRVHQHFSFRWDTIPSHAPSPEKPDFRTFQATLKSAISKQFRADTPVGVMLSGGADSSLLYAYWYQQSGISLPSFTIQTEKKYEKKYADASHALRLGQQYPSAQELIAIDQRIFLQHWEEYLLSLDQPMGDSASFLTWMIGKKAKGSVKVLIGGAGADELWGGYQRHVGFNRYLSHAGFWTTWSPILAKLPWNREIKKFLNGIDRNPNKTFLNFSALENPDSELYPDFDRYFNPSLDPYKRMLDFDRQVYLVEDVLKIHDHALMAHSIEGRSPYLDAEMISLWESVTDHSLLVRKPWIKASLSEIGLDWIANRKKFGFGLPLQEWLQEDGPFAQRVFSTLKAWADLEGKLLPQPILEVCKHPEQAAKNQFLTLYNLFLWREWVNLRS